MSLVAETIRRMIAPLHNRVMLTIGRCVIRATHEAAGDLQKVQASFLKGELRDNVERLQEYGFVSKPLPGAEGVAVFIGGDRGHGVIIATDDRRYRISALQDGDVALYNDEGTAILLGRNNKITIQAAGHVQFSTPLVTMLGDLEVVGDIKDNSGSGGATMKDMRDTYNTHTHVETGSVTQPPTQQVP